MAPEPREIPTGIDATHDAGDFDESSDLCDFGYVLVRRETNPVGEKEPRPNP